MESYRSATIAVLLAVACSAASAQSLFKCGATFQDKPCDSDVQKKYSSLTGSFSKEQVNAAADTQCADLGSRAIPIIQARANKETAESLHAQIDAKTIGRLEKVKQKELVSAVYAKSGSPAEIRGALETDCMESKQTGRAIRGGPGRSDDADISRSSRASARAETAARRAAEAAARASSRY